METTNEIVNLKVELADAVMNYDDNLIDLNEFLLSKRVLINKILELENNEK